MGFDHQKILRTFRLGLVILITFLVTWYFEVPEGEWSLITACIVLFEYTTVGGVLTKSYLRFVATFSSAFYSLCVIYFFDNNVYVNMIAAVAGLFVYTYYFMDTKQGYVGILGSVTLTIMLFNYNNIDAAVLRPFNILIGIVIAVIVLRFFYPEYARDRLKQAQADFVGHLVAIIQNFLDTNQSLETVKAEYLVHENKLITDMAAFNRYAEESRIETKKTPELVSKNINAFVHLKRLYRLLSVLIYHIATEDIRKDFALRENLTQLIGYMNEITQAILNPHFSCSHLRSKQITEDHAIIDGLFTGIFHEIALFETEISQINQMVLEHYEKSYSAD